jgi:hypothetical protein
LNGGSPPGVVEMMNEDKRLFEVLGSVSYAFSFPVSARDEHEAKILFWQTKLDADMVNMLDHIEDLHISSVDQICDCDNVSTETS